MAPTQQFFKVPSIFGPKPVQDDRFMDMPTVLPTRQNPMNPPLINRNVSTGQPPTPTSPYGLSNRQSIYGPGLEEDNEVMEAFKQNVLNPPQREHMTYPGSTLDTLNAALKIAAEQTPTEKNRVYVDGQAYQKQRVMYDPVTGEQKFITTVKDPSFSDNVLRAMAEGGTKGAIDVLNQPYADAVTDWKLQQGGLKDYATTEGLAEQRKAQAQIGIPAQAQARLMDAQTRERLSLLKDLPESKRLEMVQDGRMSLAEYNASAAMKRVEAQQAGANYRTGVQQAGATTRTGMQQSGAMARTQAQQSGATSRNQANIDAAASRQQVAGQQRMDQIERRAQLAQEKGLSPSQQRIQTQQQVAEFQTTNPDLADAITFDEQGFPIIEHEDPVVEAQIFDQIYGSPNTDINLPAPRPPTAVTPSGQRAPIGTPNMVMHPNAPKTAVRTEYSASRNQTRITYSDGTQQIVQGPPK